MPDDPNAGGQPPANPPAPDPAKPAAPPAEPSKGDAPPAEPAKGDAPADPAKSADQPKQDDAPKADAPKPPAVPEKYELKLPQDSHLDASVLERTAATARALGLSQEHAQKALEFVHAEVAAQRDAFLQAHQPGGAEWVKQEEAWRTAALADTEVGGSPEQLQASAELGKRVLGKFGSPGLTEFLEKTGFGSHPEVLRFTTKIGKAMSEGSLALPSAQGGSSEQEKLARMYPSMNPR